MVGLPTVVGDVVSSGIDSRDDSRCWSHNSNWCHNILLQAKSNSDVSQTGQWSMIGCSKVFVKLTMLQYIWLISTFDLFNMFPVIVIYVYYWENYHCKRVDSLSRLIIRQCIVSNIHFGHHHLSTRYFLQCSRRSELVLSPWTKSQRYKTWDHLVPLINETCVRILLYLLYAWYFCVNLQLKVLRMSE